MLVFSRRVGQSIIIDGRIRVRLVKIKDNGAVRIGVEAPREIPVHREEVFQRIQEGRES